MGREKVIKGFTVCSEHGLLNGEDCHGHYEYTDNLADIIKANDYSKQCPYNGSRTGCVKTLAKEALAMLKEQEAVEPRRDANCVRMFRCGACGEYVGFIDSDPGDPNEQDNYCRNCGRKVKWE